MIQPLQGAEKHRLDCFFPEGNNCGFEFSLTVGAADYKESLHGKPIVKKEGKDLIYIVNRKPLGETQSERKC